MEKDMWSAVVFWHVGKAANLEDTWAIAALREDQIIGSSEYQCN